MTDKPKLLDMTAIVESAPNAPTRELRECASLLHGRIVLLSTNTFRELATKRNTEDCRNVIVSALVSALAEMTLGLEVPRDHVVALLDTQIEKITGKVHILGM